jgi:hypothetical protein
MTVLLMDYSDKSIFVEIVFSKRGGGIGTLIVFVPLPGSFPKCL